jgi:hypothetical protein
MLSIDVLRRLLPDRDVPNEEVALIREQLYLIALHAFEVATAAERDSNDE